MLFVYPPQSISTTGLATEAKQDVIIAEVQDVEAQLVSANAELDSQTALLTTIDADTGAIATSTASLDTKTPALVSGRVPVDGSGVTQPVSAASLPLPTGAATEASLSAQATNIALLEARMAGSLVPEAYDEVVQTYVGSTTRLNTVTFKLATVTVKTLTFTYDGNDRLTGVVAT